MAVFLLLAMMVVSVEMKSVDIESERTATKRDSVCFGDLGCFSTDPPFTSPERPLAVVPYGPDHIKTTFLLYTRAASTTHLDLDARYPDTVKSVWPSFAKKPTKFLIHGFLDSPTLTTLWHDLKNELLQHGDYNVVIVDWSNGNLPPYDQASANARVVGAQIAALVQQLVTLELISVADVHIIGHSLGAQVCGYAGERIPGLGRITGLDPAGPYFDNTDKVVRLDETDALFVDVIHSDAKNLLALGLGTITQCGHVDFYPNLGHDQPGCTRDPLTNIINDGLVEGIEDTLACSHIRSHRYFTESVNSKCPFMGFPCASEEDFKNNLCHTCTTAGCAPMGFNADTKKPADGQRVKYFLSTASEKPFCQYHLTVNLKLAQGVGETEKGKIDLTVNGAEGSKKVSLTADAMNFAPGETYKFYVMVPTDLGTVQSVVFEWDLVTSVFDPLHWNILGWRHPKVYLDEIDVSRDEESVDVHLCASNAANVETGHTLTLSTTC
jgi:pimeloyl-ACP methyl ester carboxylesterase